MGTPSSCCLVNVRSKSVTICKKHSQSTNHMTPIFQNHLTLQQTKKMRKKNPSHLKPIGALAYDFVDFLKNFRLVPHVHMPGPQNRQLKKDRQHVRERRQLHNQQSRRYSRHRVLDVHIILYTNLRQSQQSKQSRAGAHACRSHFAASAYYQCSWRIECIATHVVDRQLVRHPGRVENRWYGPYKLPNRDGLEIPSSSRRGNEPASITGPHTQCPSLSCSRGHLRERELPTTTFNTDS